jgi:threonine dehydratase
MTVELSDIQEARRLLDGIIIKTPILSDEKLSNAIGAEAHLKAECLQRAGSFKMRGAFNKISRLSDDEKLRGVVTASAGNHAQGVALAARLNNIRSTIVLPVFAPLTKVMATKAQGADVILHGNTFDEAVAYSKELGEEKGLVYVHAFDDDRIIAGQGTIGCEIADSLPNVTVVVVPVGGGGVIAGIAIAVRALLPNARVIGVQAANCSSIAPSLGEGKPLEPVHYQPTIADGIAVKRPGEKTLPIIRELVDEVVTVTEEEIARGVFHCVQNNHLVVEGAGAAGVAALLAGRIGLRPYDVVCSVLCGGNIDANLLTRVLDQVLVHQGRYIMLKVLVADRPGMLAGLLEQVAETGANVIEVFHRRAMWLAPLGQVGIETLLEVRDEEHSAEVIAHLENSGYQVERENVGRW